MTRRPPPVWHASDRSGQTRRNINYRASFRSGVELPRVPIGQSMESVDEVACSACFSFAEYFWSNDLSFFFPRLALQLFLGAFVRFRSFRSHRCRNYSFLRMYFFTTTREYANCLFNVDERGRKVRHIRFEKAVATVVKTTHIRLQLCRLDWAIGVVKYVITWE